LHRIIEQFISSHKKLLRLFVNHSDSLFSLSVRQAIIHNKQNKIREK